ncbi:Trk system potassium transport protein TrkA [Solemya pervernicosa gill symbiont]|uniref:Trk system potassium uptake protein TrkA n=2 Tax=Gammaproteobacteria incertae sedis TaxID=118884 RepID=A0A1T2L827_9GAMM|nr:Trk system potassium transporter TrkA [Candidatus Reidiella endopervernicosa]OOZ41259.1 Trk system potassium transport protein TrkA [Solemya pervernicosa gill symbiont]QKQ25256.1 Trk system potassium transporter TrkA [Candidatus Reidiella endopervernicosa]
MKIIILGAGQVGASVAHNLASEANDITVVDQRSEILRDLQDRLDLRTVAGYAAHPDVLIRAGAEDADMILAVTNSDETNMVACQVAYTLFRTPTKIARVRSVEFLAHPRLFSQESLPIDVLISPEQLVTDDILRLVRHPGALQVLDFAAGRVQLVAVRAYYGGPLVGHELHNLRDHMPGIDTRVAAIFRRGKPIIPEGDTVIEADDEVFFVAARKNIRAVMSELRRLDKPVKRIMIAGGGNIGTRLAKALESNYYVKIVEHNRVRARQLSEQLNSAIVLQGDVADEELLLEENIEDTDIFCALTNDDEANILSAMLAKRLGARKVMSLINRASYVDLVESSSIDIAISPQQATIGSLLAHVRRGDVAMVHSLRRGAAEAIEAVAHGDSKNSKVVGRQIDEITLPPGTTIGAIVRGSEVLMAHHDTIIEAEDHVIMFLVDKQRIAEVETLFQVDVTFF